MFIMLFLQQRFDVKEVSVVPFWTPVSLRVDRGSLGTLFTDGPGGPSGDGATPTSTVCSLSLSSELLEYF